MRNQVVAILIIFFAVILSAIIAPFVIKCKKGVAINEEAERVRMINDSLQKENFNLNKSLFDYQVVIDSLSGVSREGKTKIVYLNKAKDEKIKIIDKLSSDGLDSLFAAIKFEAGKDTAR